ncbi:uncharacterized protein OCT59_018758 [Rhizophagus irregularis]|uniref:uncharacterized protein n=1 Tax=Rhizophagus irregularis TaxID=588596 RepID=UPI00331C76AA|nr:hypothetical protein OCT59_018758 [Rhizophagus irregularis]
MFIEVSILFAVLRHYKPQKVYATMYSEKYLKITSALLPPSQPPPDECLPMLYLSNKKFAVTKCQLCLISFFHIKAGPSHTSNQNKSI